MPKNFSNGIDLHKGPIQNAAYQVLASDPSAPVLGQFYFNSTTGRKRTFNGSTWDESGTGNATGDVSSNTASSADGEIALFSGTGGKTLKRMTGSGLVKVTNGVASVYTLVEADIPTLSQSKIASLGTDLTARELIANKSTSTSLGNSDTLYPTQNAVKVYTDSAISAATVGLLNDRGNYDASGNGWPTTGGSGSAGAVKKGDLWTISVAGTLGGSAVTAGDVIRALANAPGQTATNWAIGETNIGYVAEAASNKVTVFSSPTDAQYPSAKLVKDQLDLKAPLASPALTGNPTAPTQAAGNSSTRLATTAFVQGEGFTRKVTALIGNASATSFVVTHNLNTKNVVVSVRKVSTDDIWITDATAGNVNSVTVAFGFAPTANEFEVTVIG